MRVTLVTTNGTEARILTRLGHRRLLWRPSLPPTAPPSSGKPLPALMSRKRPEEGLNAAKQPP